MLDSKVVKNIFYLLIVQGTNYILPLLVVPFLIAKMGVENYGSVAIMQSILAFSLVLIDYGFVFIGPKKIAEDAKGEGHFSVFLTVTVCRLILACLVVISVISYALLGATDVVVTKMVVAGCVHLFFQAIYAPWFFQGLQRMGYITIFSLIGRLLALIPCFIFIESYDDAPLFFYFLGLGSFVQAVLTVYLVFGSVKNKFFRLRVIEYFREGFFIFFSRIFVNVYTTAIPSIIGLFFGQYQAGVYSAIEKVVRGVASLQGPFIQALYPFIIRGKGKADKESLKIYSLPFLGYLLFIVFVGFFGSYVLEILKVPIDSESLFIFHVLSCLPVLLCISGYLGICKLLANNRNKEFSLSIMLSAFSFLGCVFVVVNYLDFKFFAFSSIVAELVAICFMIYFTTKAKKGGTFNAEGVGN